MDSFYESIWGGFDEKKCDWVESNWKTGQKRQFENSDIDSDWAVTHSRAFASLRIVRE